MDLQWAVTDDFTLYGGIALQDATLAENFCKSLGLDGEPLPQADCIANDPADFAPSGTQLPTTPRFKANLTGRYEFPMAGFEAHLQASLVHNDSSRSALLPAEAEVLGPQDAYSLVDLAFGVEKESWSAVLFVDNAFDERASLYRYSECDVAICGGIVYGVQLRPRTVGLKFAQKF
jgi:iron complex outermembrane receptor protein